MFSYIVGKVADIQDNILTVETNGIGYEITVSADVLSTAATSVEIKIFTYLNVREDGVSLYGFATKSEKNMFLRLITISGIGPKVAVNILSSIKGADLAAAVATGDVKKLSAAKGVGKKTAERIVLELKDKIGKEIGINDAISSTMPYIAPENNDALLALVSLGYTKAEAQAGIAKLSGENLTTEQIIFKVLKG